MQNNVRVVPVSVVRFACLAEVVLPLHLQHRFISERRLKIQVEREFELVMRPVAGAGALLEENTGVSVTVSSFVHSRIRRTSLHSCIVDSTSI
jgi:hypothetical protein